MSWIPSLFGNSSVFKDFHFPSSLTPYNSETSAFANIRMDRRKTSEAHVFKAELPGLSKEEIKVEIEDDRMLQMSGERKTEKEDNNGTYHLVECSSDKYWRKFRLLENVKMNQAKVMGFLPLPYPR